MPDSVRDDIEIHLSPSPAEWRPRVPDNAARRFRDQIGLPTDRQVILSGHQAEIWHPGILAKRLAAEACAERAGGAAAWLVVDHDDNDPVKLTRPTRDAKGRLAVEEVALCSARVPKGTPTGSRVAIDLEVEFEHVDSALRGRAGAVSMAEQFARAGESLAASMTGSDEQPLVFASRLTETDLFQQLVDRLIAEPAEAVRAYNEAAASEPSAGVRALIARESAGRFELPLWRVRAGEPRMPVYSTNLTEIPRSELAPRALLMTLICRQAACDLFVHGTGGGAYDLITERWAKAWLGAELAPMTVATATLTLDLGVEPVTREDLARARWRAHHARHDPAEIGASDAASKKRELVAAIDAADQPAGPFNQMHALLTEYRRDHADELAQLDADVERIEGHLADAEVVRIRTWPFPLHAEPDLRALRAEIRSRFGLDS